MLIKINYIWKTFLSVTESSFYCVCVSTCASRILISMVCLHVHLMLFKITAMYDLKKNPKTEDVICYINNPFVPVNTFFKFKRVVCFKRASQFRMIGLHS